LPVEHLILLISSYWR